jgi:hypothetical protein
VPIPEDATDPSMRMSMSCGVETKSAFEDFAASHKDDIDAMRSVRPQNLDGNTAAWVVIATLGAQVIPYFLTFLSDELKRHRVERVKIGDVEIEHPSQEDLRLLRQMLHKRLGTGHEQGD